MKLVLDHASKAPEINEMINEPMCILFFADWCPHCVAIKCEYKGLDDQLWL